MYFICFFLVYSVHINNFFLPNCKNLYTFFLKKFFTACTSIIFFFYKNLCTFFFFCFVFFWFTACTSIIFFSSISYCKNLLLFFKNKNQCTHYIWIYHYLFHRVLLQYEMKEHDIHTNETASVKGTLWRDAIL